MDRMDRHELDNLGEELRNLGHRRRELVMRVAKELKDDNAADAQSLCQELTDATDEAISLMQHQLESIGDEVHTVEHPSLEAAREAFPGVHALPNEPA